MSVSQAPAVPAYWGSLTPGPYSVGFQQRWVIDSTRRLPAGKAAGPAFRPILMNVWYPSSVRAGSRMRYRDYFDGAERSAASIPLLPNYARALVRFELGKVTEEIMRSPDRGSLPPDRRRLFDDFLDAPTAVRRNVLMAHGSFPIVIYFQGSQSTYDDNVALCEYLASRGYVVLGSAYPAEDNGGFATNVIDRSRERDARHLLVEVRRFPNVDPARVTVIGHSAGAQAALLFSADPSAPIDAVLSLDTTQDYWTLEDRRFAYFTDPVLERRREIKTPTVFFANPRAMFELGDSLSACRRWYVTVESVEHNDFITQGIIHRELSSSTPAERAEATAARRSFDGMVTFIERWLAAQRSGSRVAVGGLGPLSVVEVPIGETGPTLQSTGKASPREVRHLLSSRGEIEAVGAILRTRAADSTAPAGTVDVALALVEKLALGPEPVRARDSYERLVAADTAYRSVFRSMTLLGRYWDGVGDRSLALTWWRMAATINPTDSVAARRSKPDRK
ncbi:MAG TPA: hypothetical protein VHE78_17200 [Gemmatimonadaceae bacterium]|nr:hypothetical protein [Gemmatimonadaceae bacterium]